MLEPLLPVLLSPAILLLAFAGSLVVGAVYFLRSSPAASLGKRITHSAYAPVSAALFVLAVSVPVEVLPGPKYAAYALAQVVPLLLACVSLFWYPGPKWLHAVLVPIALVCGAWLFGWGSVLAYGK